MAERRQYERVSFHCKVEVSEVGGSARVKAWTTDISLGGTRIATPVLFPNGKALTIAFLMSDPTQGEIREEVQGHVVNVQSNIDGHAIGVVFQEPLARARCPKLVGRVERL
jgi:PilZ domain